MRLLFNRPKTIEHAGFTLIELLVVVAITAIVVGGSIAGFMSFAKRQEVYTTTREVQQLFRSAKTKAQVHEKPATNCDTLLSYQVIVIASKVSIRPVCEVGPNVVLGGVAADYPYVNLPSGVTIDPLNDYRYYTLEGGATFANGNPLNTAGHKIELDSTSAGVTYEFTITGGGAISNVEKY